jgi:hypothetical protein
MSSSSRFARAREWNQLSSSASNSPARRPGKENLREGPRCREIIWETAVLKV